mgnify:CR=1 FL=1|tara:strand:+ start:333 stop:683 length:351 start_codon:yes stop_codon:yes gene_type:complete
MAKDNKSGAPKGIKKKKNESSYASYAAKVLKLVHAENNLGISNAAMQAVCLILSDLEDKLSAQAVKITAYHKKGTVMAPHFQAATMMRLPPELAKHAVAEGHKAVRKFEGKGVTAA